MQCLLANAPPVEVRRLAEPTVENFRELDHRLFMFLVWCALLTLILLTLTLLSGSACGGVVIAKFSGHAVTLRRSPTVFAETPMFGSIDLDSHLIW
jgi:hypothetical protein